MSNKLFRQYVRQIDRKEESIVISHADGPDKLGSYIVSHTAAPSCNSAVLQRYTSQTKHILSDDIIAHTAHMQSYK